MVRDHIKLLILFSALLLILSACTTKIDEEKEKAVDTAKMAFMDAQEKPNAKSDKIKFFLPEGYDIKEEKKHNILLDNKGNPVLIFINPNEKETSEIISDNLKKAKDTYIAFDTFKQEGRVGAIAIKEQEEDQYELVISVGGVKVTTQTNTKELAQYSEELMKIASSINQ